MFSQRAESIMQSCTVFSLKKKDETCKNGSKFSLIHDLKMLSTFQQEADLIAEFIKKIWNNSDLEDKD